MKIKIEQVTDADKAIIQNQLKSEDIISCSIFERCSYGIPRVLLLNPIKDNKPDYEAISNLFWLSCPYLNEEIHKLEDKGFIKTINEIIHNNSSYKVYMKNAHSHFYFLRRILCRNILNDDQDDINFLKRGIGGVHDLDTIKCLHINLTHHRICNNNIAGLITYNLLNKKMECKGCLCR